MERLIHTIRRHALEKILILLLVAGVCGIMNCAVPNEKAPTGAKEAPGFSKTYPHAADWLIWSEHGRYTFEEGATGCETCHGTDFRGGWSGSSCLECHEYPHADGWALASQHGLHVINEEKEGCATICHGVDFEGGDTGISCFACHRFYPHPSTWVVTHEDVVEDEDEKDCATVCHGTDLGGGDSGVACADCHKWNDDIFN